MKRTTAILGSTFFLLIAPGIVAGLIPWAISGWRWQPAFFGVTSLPWLGGALIVAGLPMLLDSFARFALEGLGTPAPVYPTDRLIATGLYRYMRNPMYVGLAAIIWGQALLIGNAWLVVYGAFVWLAFSLFVILYEEPTLRRSYGAQYDDYCAHVPRWLPRLSPYSEPTSR